MWARRICVVANLALVVGVLANTAAQVWAGGPAEHLESVWRLTFWVGVLGLTTLLAVYLLGTAERRFPLAPIVIAVAVGHSLLAVVSLAGLAPGPGAGDDYWVPILAIPMVLSIASVVSLAVMWSARGSAA